MSSRPRDWHPLADTDPVPGDPDQVAALGRKLRKTADELQRQIRNLKAVAEVDAWDSKAGHEFRSRAKGSVKKLEAALQRYETAADALGATVTEADGTNRDRLHTAPTSYASDLNRAQEVADTARKEARGAEDRKTAAQRGIERLPGDDKSGKKRFEEQHESAADAIAAAREKIILAKELRDNSAKRAAEAIDAVISGDSLTDGFWDKFDDWVDWVGTKMETLATYFGVAALAVGWIPVIGQALAGVLGALATVATLVSALATVIQVLRGDKGLKDLAFTVLGLALMGVGKAFSKIAGRYAEQALGKLGKVGVARTARQRGRAEKKVNLLAGDQVNWKRGQFRESLRRKLEPFKLEPGEGWKSIKEPFAEPFSKAWGENLRVLKPGQGNYQAAWGKVVIRGDGNAVVGVGRSLSAADPGVASHLKDIKFAARGLDDLGAVNRISRTATGFSVAGTAVTSAGMALDSNLNPLLG
ncbi:hypothetical protein [Streptomyces sp. NPDC058739]|uniref:hypothetical protein n=1 Tax=Streptomyces sp. NPDC058739 TaxID=3346618 RepID=UPI0036AEFFD6